MIDGLATIFEPALQREIDSQAKILSIREGEILLRIGDIVRIMPIVITGSLKVSRIDEEEHELLLYYVNPGESCAMTFTCCMQTFPSEIQIVAEEETTFLAVPVNLMDSWLAKFPTWKSFVMRTIRNRFNELLKTIDLITFQHLDERLIHYLKEKSKVTGSSILNLSHDQIAKEMATARAVVSRLLKKLENDNRVILYRNQIKLLRDL